MVDVHKAPYSKIGLKADIHDKKILVTIDDKTVPFDLEIASQFHKIYENLCTAEFIQENAEVSDEEAYEWANEVRDLMDDNYPDLSEEDAIIEVLEKHGLDWDELCSKERDDE